MYAAKYIFSRKFFEAWVVVSIIWVWGTMLIAGFFPIFDGRDQIGLVFRGLWGARKKRQHEETTLESDPEPVKIIQENRSSLKGLETRERSGSVEKSV